MIRINRGEEPIELVRERSRQLAVARLRGSKPTDFVGYDAEDVRNWLVTAQENRCAYCGRFIEDVGDPIEHFRPKARSENIRWDALRQPPPVDHGQFFQWFDEHVAASSSWESNEGRYWWLAWSWENLFLSCVTCNTSTWKGTKFPLKAGTTPLQEWDELPGKEQPLLLDPEIVDPLDHIRFVPDRAPDGWGPIPLTDEGRWTIALLGLNKRTGLRTQWMVHAAMVENHPNFQLALAAMSQGDDGEVSNLWNDLVKKLLFEVIDFLALRWCVFDYHFPEDYRAAHNLPLPRPGRASNRTPNPLWEVRVELDAFPRQLQDRVRALGGTAPEAEMRSLIIDLCTVTPLSVIELRSILRRETATVRRYLGALTEAREPSDPLGEYWDALRPSRLTFDPTTRKYRPTA